MSYTLCITGSRTCQDVEFIRSGLLYLMKNYGRPSLFIHGGCRGVDLIGDAFAREHSIPVKEFIADWNTYGRSAGPIRNKQMAEFLNPSKDVCIAFWDGVSKGTMNMINLCMSRGVHTLIEVY